MCTKSKSYGAACILPVTWLLPMLVLAASAIAVSRPALANGEGAQNTGQSQADSQYWTEERMRSAKPAMPTVPGTPKDGAATPRPSGPPRGSPSRGPEVEPDHSERQQ